MFSHKKKKKKLEKNARNFYLIDKYFGCLPGSIFGGNPLTKTEGLWGRRREKLRFPESHSCKYQNIVFWVPLVGHSLFKRHWHRHLWVFLRVLLNFYRVFCYHERGGNVCYWSMGASGECFKNRMSSSLLHFKVFLQEMVSVMFLVYLAGFWDVGIAA